MNKTLKYNQAKMAIVDMIANLNLSAGDQLPTERALVKMLPFSIITIRRALQDLESSGLIKRRASRGNFLNSSIAESPVSGNIGVLRIIRPDRPRHTLPEIFSLYGYMQSRGIGVRYLESDTPNKSVLDMFRNCIGIIITDWISQEWINFIRILELPVLVVGPNPCPAVIPTVNYDWETASFLLTRHFLDRGCRKIGLINGASDWVPARQIYSGYCKALQQAGVEADERMTAYTGFESSHQDILRFLHANTDCNALLVEELFTFMQSVWQMRIFPKAEIGWINSVQNQHLRFPGALATFPDPVFTMAARIFLDHLLLQKPLPLETQVAPILFRDGCRVI